MEAASRSVVALSYMLRKLGGLEITKYRGVREKFVSQ